MEQAEDAAVGNTADAWEVREPERIGEVYALVRSLLESYRLVLLALPELLPRTSTVKVLANKATYHAEHLTRVVAATLVHTGHTSTIKVFFKNENTLLHELKPGESWPVPVPGNCQLNDAYLVDCTREGAQAKLIRLTKAT